MRIYLPPTLLSLILLIIPSVILADPASVPFSDCFDEQDSLDQKFNVSTVFAQVLQNSEWGKYLNLTVVGASPRSILGLAENSSSLSTLFTTSSVLTLNAWSNSSYLCQTMRPQSPLPAINSTDGTFCPMNSGPFAFSSTIPWGTNRDLTTLITRLRAVDPFGKELMCLDLLNTPLDPMPKSPYGKANIIFWSTVALAAGYWIVVGFARIVSAWGRGLTRPERGIWLRAQSAGYILASAISGERLAASPALMRFCTPSLRDVIFHTQWCAVLAMVAVEWPQFVYPLLTQTAWSTLSYNISVTHSSVSHHWNSLNSTPFAPPTVFADQFSDPTSPIFLNESVPNVLFTLPEDATQGMSSFAYTIGIRPQDLFPTCLILFLSIVSATIIISLMIWAVDYTTVVACGSFGSQAHANRSARAKSPAFSANKDSGETVLDESKSLTGSGLAASPLAKIPSARFSLPLANSTSDRGINPQRSWWRLRTDIGTFHGSVLHGNLVRILVLFHLPVTIFSCYQMTLSRNVVGTSSVVLAALSFIIFSILIPAHLVIRVTFTTTNKLYDETRTLLSLGPLYNHYRHGSQLFASLFFATNISFGVTIGGGQRSGTAQAIIILVIEVISALVTSIWLPWGSGASMGLISFLFCVARIVIAVLLVILTQAISIGAGAGGWVACGILIILAIVYLALVLMLLVKCVEGLVRIFGRVGFDRSRHAVDSGLLGACGLLGCCGSRKRKSRRRSYKRKATEIPPHLRTRDSDLSSYLPPVGGIIPNGAATPPRFFNRDTARRSSANSQPPSVLKPEQANTPYKEELQDNEDEGYIMGAWKPFPKPSIGYTTIVDAQQTFAPTPIFKPQPQPKTSSFSRIGGGRAHIDSPYSIATGSTHTFPSIRQQSQTQFQQIPSSSPVGPPVLYEHEIDDHLPSMQSILNIPPNAEGLSIGVNGLPQGAMQPAHIRTKSQSAVIENYLPSNPASSSSIARQFPLPSPRQKTLSEDAYLRPSAALAAHKFTIDDDDESADEEDQQKKKKPWYRLGRHRAYSTEGRLSAATSSLDVRSGNIDEELGGGGATPSQRSFVVIRKPASSMMSRSGQPVPNLSLATSQVQPKDISRPPTR